MKDKKNCNYDNRALNQDEKLVLYFLNEADIDSYKNPDSIKHFFVGKSSITGALTAFKKGTEAELAKKQFYSYIRDLNGQFHCKNALSMNLYEDTFHTEPVSNDLSPEQMMELQDTSIRMVQRLMDEAPQYLAAVIFHRHGLKGKEFDTAMRIGHTRSAELQKELSSCLYNMIYLGYDQVELPKRKTKHDNYYKQIALNFVEEILNDILEMCSRL